MAVKPAQSLTLGRPGFEEFAAFLRDWAGISLRRQIEAGPAVGPVLGVTYRGLTSAEKESPSR